MASRSRTLYTGVTKRIYRRAMQHKKVKSKASREKYRINRLVYYEIFKYITSAIAREKKSKRGRAPSRLVLIESTNPTVAGPSRGLGCATTDPSLRSG